MAEVSSSPFARNTTGVPSSEEIVLSGGELFLHELDADGDEDGDGWVNLGEVRELALEPTSEFLEHYSTRSGRRVLDKKILLQQKFDVRIGLEAANERNAAIFFQATPEAITNPAVAGFTEFAMITAVELGRWYQVVNSAGLPARGITTGNLLLEKDAVSDVTLVEGTDYELDTASGMVFFKTTATNIADGNTVNATLTAAAGADTTRRIPVQSRENVTVALKFLGVDGASGRKFELYIPKITLAASGAFGLVTNNEWTQMQLTGAAEKKDADTAVAYISALPAATA
jgi:hypothetical protein